MRRSALYSVVYGLILEYVTVAELRRTLEGRGVNHRVILRLIVVFVHLVVESVDVVAVVVQLLVEVETIAALLRWDPILVIDYLMVERSQVMSGDTPRVDEHRSGAYGECLALIHAFRH